MKLFSQAEKWTCSYYANYVYLTFLLYLINQAIKKDLLKKIYLLRSTVYDLYSWLREMKNTYKKLKSQEAVLTKKIVNRETAMKVNHDNVTVTEKKHEEESHQNN